MYNKINLEKQGALIFIYWIVIKWKKLIITSAVGEHVNLSMH